MKLWILPYSLLVGTLVSIGGLVLHKILGEALVYNLVMLGIMMVVMIISILLMPLLDKKLGKHE